MHVNGSNGVSSNFNSTGAIDQTEYQDEQEIDLVKLFNLILLNKWKIVSVTFIFALAAAVISLIMTPIYSSSGTIIISESQNRYSYAGSDLSSLLTTTYGIGVGSTIANELQVLRSVALSFELAERISEIEVDENGNKFPILMRSYPDDPTSTSLDTVAMRYRELISFSKVDPDADLVRISFESPSPVEAATIVNLTMDTYTTLSTDQNRKTTGEALEFLRGERDRFITELEKAEESLRVFMNETQLIAVDPQANELITNISQIEADRKIAEVSLVAINSSIKEYENQLNEIKPGLADQYSEAVGPIIERYQFQLAEFETEKMLFEIKNPGIDSSNPEIRRLENQISEVKERITQVTDNLISSGSTLYLSFANRGDGSVTQRVAEISEKLIELEVEHSQYETQEQVLNDYLDELNTEFEKLPDNIIQLARLQREVSTYTQSYELVSSNYFEMSLWEQTQFGLGRTLDYALVPLEPVKPRKRIIVLIGLFLGGIFSIGFVILRNLLDDKIKSTDTLRDFKLPMLGAIPDFAIMDGLDSTGRQYIDNKSVSNQLITFLDHISPVSEAYRRLRINVVYANPDKQYKVIMVTSAGKGEGKSTVAANLAVTFSEAEKSVLLIDLDLRRPTQHKIFGENREPGLTDTLFETVRLSQIVNTTIAPNVDLLTVGKKTPEPATVLDSKRLKQLIDKLSERYDHIILDTAPYGIISDSASLLRLVDGIVVVSRFNVTTKRELGFTIEGLQHLNADILGLVLNAFDPEKSTDYYTNYSYYKKTYYADYYAEDKK
ncbi:MAG: polysaccharide biosynthesis tyrosine autokinase [Balneolales bacterium]|nr:polysaccharide biosynthesis tyrosine autokinase [Balneolales bacterium]